MRCIGAGLMVAAVPSDDVERRLRQRWVQVYGTEEEYPAASSQELAYAKDSRQKSKAHKLCKKRHQQITMKLQRHQACDAASPQRSAVVAAPAAAATAAIAAAGVPARAVRRGVAWRGLAWRGVTNPNPKPKPNPNPNPNPAAGRRQVRDRTARRWRRCRPLLLLLLPPPLLRQQVCCTRSAVWCDLAWRGAAWCHVAWSGLLWLGVAWRGAAWPAMAWCACLGILADVGLPWPTACACMFGWLG